MEGHGGVWSMAPWDGGYGDSGEGRAGQDIVRQGR